MREERPVPEDLREQYLRYRVNIRVLGVLRRTRRQLHLRRLPTADCRMSAARWPFRRADVLQEIAGHNIAGAPIGHFALGEYIYAAGQRYTGARSRTGCRSDEPEIAGQVPS